MAHIQWKDRYNIGFREIDAQHHGLLDLLNELSDQMDGQKHPGSVAQIFVALGDYAKTHFSTEERYMQAAGYSKLADHRQEHAAFVARVQELSRAYDPGDPHLAEEASAFLRDWYLNHIIKSDQDYVPHLKRALPTAPIEAILFGLEGVVCTLDPAPLLQALGEASGKPEAEVQGALWEDPGLLEAGQWDLERFATEGASWAGKPLDLEVLAAASAASFRPVPAMLRLAAQLKQHQPVGLVGNATPWLRSHGLAPLGLEGLFNAEALSCEAGLRLPDKGLFLAAAERLGLAPDTCLLIHRDPACLDAAQAIRMQTLDYTTPVMLMAQLRRMGVPF
jgi:hemerythrin